MHSIIGHKVDIKTFKPKLKVETNSFEEALLTHYDFLSSSNKKLVKQYFKNNVHYKNGYSEYKLEDAIQQYLFEIRSNVPFPGPESGEEKFTFIDLFAGIGGFRMAMQNLGGKCVFSSEWDKHSQQTYKANFGEIPFGDITKDEIKNLIPKKFDVLCGGFPCQPFSIAGVSKKNSLGRKHGFDDVKQGNLFFHIEEIISKHRPKVFFLENVKNLISHDKGNTFKVIKESLLKLGYSFDSKVLDGKYFVPQHRERTIMVGFDKNVFGDTVYFDFNSVKLPNADHKFERILEKKVDSKYTLSKHLWEYLQNYAKKHKEKGNGFGFGLVNVEGISRTMSARYYKDGAEILIPQKSGIPRRLVPKEAAALFGYPKDFKIPVSDTQAYRQFGNSVVMPLIQAVGSVIVDKIIAKV